MALIDSTIRNAKPQSKQYRLEDGKGLCLLVKQNSGIYWYFRYRHEPKENEIFIGPELLQKMILTNLMK